MAEKDDGKRLVKDGNVPGWRDFAHAQRAAWSLNIGPCSVLPDNSIFTARAIALQALY